MKQLLCIILVLCLCLGMTACAVEPEEEQFYNPISFYFVRNETDLISHETENSVLAAVVREGGKGPIDLIAVLNQYLSDPGSETVHSPFPDGTILIELRQNGDILDITLSNHIASLTGMDLTLACACLTRTMLELTGAQTLRIHTQSLLLDGKTQIAMTMDDLILLDVATQAANNGG